MSHKGDEEEGCKFCPFNKDRGTESMSKRMQCKRSFEIIFFKYKNNRIFQKYLYSQQICSEGNLLIVYVVWVEVRHLQLLTVAFMVRTPIAL